MAAIAVSVLRIVFRLRATVILGATGIATSAASAGNATGMTATAAIVLIAAIQLPVVLVRLPMATVGVTETATAAASTRRATGITATAAIFLKLVT